MVNMEKYIIGGDKMETPNSCSNNVLILKRAIATQGPQKRSQLISYLQQNWRKEIGKEEASRLVDMALKARQTSFFKDKEDRWNYNRRDNQINNMAYQLLNSQRQPLTERKLVAELQLSYKLSEDDIYAQMDLKSDPRFRLFKSNNHCYWALVDWTIINNLAVLELLHQDQRKMKRRDLEKKLRKDFNLDKNCLFIPELTRCFRVSGNTIALDDKYFSADQPSAHKLEDKLVEIIGQLNREETDHCRIVKALQKALPLCLESNEFIDCCLWIENKLKTNPPVKQDKPQTVSVPAPSLPVGEDAAFLARKKLAERRKKRKRIITAGDKPNTNSSRQELISFIRKATFTALNLFSQKPFSNS